MGFRQKICDAYSKWKTDTKKYGAEHDDYKQLCAKMRILKQDLCSFAVRFEKNFVNAENMTDKVANNVYNDIRDNFVGRIAKAKNFINLDYVKNIIKDLDPMGSAIYLKDWLGNLKLLFEKSDNLADLFESLAAHYDSYDALARVPKSDYSAPVRATYVLSNFFSDIFRAMYGELVVADKIALNDKDYFYDENDSGILSKVVRYLFPDYWSRSRMSYGKHTVETPTGNLKIFPQGKPLPREVRQGYVGDCYLMAALIALAKTNPKAIEKCFVQGINKIENEDNIKIRFFYKGVSIKSDPRQVIITVNKNKIISPSSIKDGALWPKLIEKAYLVYRKKGYESNWEDEKLDAGRPENVMFAITGIKPKVDEADCTNSVISEIATKLKNHNAITCDFKKEFKIKDVKSNEEIKIYTGHAYAVVGIDEKKEYVRLINPWKDGGRKVENSPKSNEGGHIAMSYKDFNKHFKTLAR